MTPTERRVFHGVRARLDTAMRRMDDSPSTTEIKADICYLLRALAIEPDNHHNALACSYCTPSTDEERYALVGRAFHAAAKMSQHLQDAGMSEALEARVRAFLASAKAPEDARQFLADLEVALTGTEDTP